MFSASKASFRSFKYSRLEEHYSAGLRFVSWCQVQVPSVKADRDGGPELPVQPTKSPELAKSEPTATSVPPANPITQIFELCQRVFGTTTGSVKFEWDRGARTPAM
ncbi:hypothetical protein HGRIS_003899 [Hohenbuehelia grisea]|uniref:Uncharacterized protein n=1 Tax=Hohenbuehelia grisea TaxID=104357 RepID=A0ABR3JH61_9AGAR